MMPSGLVNYGKGCWLNSILVSLESCDAFVTVFKKYHNGIERDASRPLLDFQLQTVSSSLLWQLSNFLNGRRISPVEIVHVLNKKLFPTDDELDLNESWIRIINQIVQELTQVQSDWAQLMLQDVSTLLEVSTRDQQRCINADESTSDGYKDPHSRTIFPEITNYSVWRNVAETFIEEGVQTVGKSVRKKAYKVYPLTKYLSTYDKQITNDYMANDLCSYCKGQLSHLFQITKHPVILKVDIIRSTYITDEGDNKGGKILKTAVGIDLQMQLDDITYNYVAMCHQTESKYKKETGFEGHNFATVMRDGKLYIIDDELVKERTIPKTQKLQDSQVICVFYQRADWRDLISDSVIGSHDVSSKCMKITPIIHNIYDYVINKYENRIEKKRGADMLSDPMVIVHQDGESRFLSSHDHDIETCIITI
jgi:uncharacterized protein YdhG (YjbR/CyaY superfamily)